MGPALSAARLPPAGRAGRRRPRPPRGGWTKVHPRRNTQSHEWIHNPKSAGSGTGGGAGTGGRGVSGARLGGNGGGQSRGAGLGSGSRGGARSGDPDGSLVAP